jgi:hypothetical protein
MTTGTVVGEHEIILNDIRYPIKGQVRSGLITTDALKIVTADHTRDSHARLSVQSWSNWQLGVGIDKFDGEDLLERKRAWDSDLQLRFDGHLVLPGLAVQTAAGAAADVGVITERANVIYAAYGTDLRSYSNTTNVWTNVATLAAAATDEENNIRIENKVYMVIATGGGYLYYDGTTFATSTKDAQFLAFWDQKLWGIDSTGQLWWSASLGTETNSAQLPIENSAVTGLFVGYDSSGLDILYASTTRGLFAHDIGNSKFIETRLRLPFHPDNGKGAVTWRDSMYISAGLAVNKYDIDANRATVDQMGPDRDDGLPSARRGNIKQLVASHNELLAIIDATSIASAGDLFLGSQQTSNNSFALDPDQGFSHIMGWDKLGWERKWLSDDSTADITWLHVSDAFNEYRMWWAQNQRVFHMQIPQNIINPVYVTDLPYAASGNHETPDFTGGQSEVDKLAVRLRVEVSGASTTETISMSFALNGSSTFTELLNSFSSDVTDSGGVGEIRTDGIITYFFDDRTTPAGTAFRSIRFKAAFKRGSTTTLTPDILRIDFEWRKKLPALWGHQVTVDMSQGHGGKTLEQMFENMRIAAENNVLSRFTFRNRTADDAGNTDPWVYFVDVVGFNAMENTGNVWSGEFELILAEV